MPGAAKFPLRIAIFLTAMNAATMFAWWGLNFGCRRTCRSPTTQGGIGLSTETMAMFIVAMQVGMWLGYVSFGFIADAFGRRPTYISYLLIAAVLVWYYGFAREPWVLLVLGPFVAFFGTGYFSGFGAVASEIFPTSIRATALGVTYNSGRLLSAIAPFIVGTMVQNRGFGAAFTLDGDRLHHRGGVVAGDSGDEGKEDGLGTVGLNFGGFCGVPL